MGTKQHTTFCALCAKTTNHVTVYQKADDGGQLIATVRCAEHSGDAARHYFPEAPAIASSRDGSCTGSGTGRTTADSNFLEAQRRIGVSTNRNDP